MDVALDQTYTKTMDEQPDPLALAALKQFHDFRIGERVTAYSPYVQQFLANQSVQNLQHSGDPAGAMQQAYRMLQASIQTNSYVMAYSECFLALGIILLVGSVTIWLCKKTKAVGAAAAH